MSRRSGSRESCLSASSCSATHVWLPKRARQTERMVGGPAGCWLLLALSCLSLVLQEPSSIQCQEILVARSERNVQSWPAIEPHPAQRRTPRALLASSELRAVSGSKNEPPSRPSQDWSKQRPYFGPDMARNVSVELGKTAYLTCKVLELGDKTVSWLRPRENEILTSGRFTYVGDPRFTSINDQGSHDWILEIKDVGLNDSTGYECQVSTDPKMSTIINLHVKAVKARIRQGEQYYAPLGSNIEFSCEIGSKPGGGQLNSPVSAVQQTYWYFNGNLLNYARAHLASDKNFSIDWDPLTQTSRFKLFNVQLHDAGNYTCKPTSAEPATIRLHVKRPTKNGSKNHYGHQSIRQKQQEAQKNDRNYVADPGAIGLDLVDSGSGLELIRVPTIILSSQLLSSVTILFLLTYRLHHQRYTPNDS